MGNNACCQQAKQDMGVLERQDELVHKKAPHSPELEEQLVEALPNSPQKVHEEIIEQIPFLHEQEHRPNIDEILEEVQINDPPNGVLPVSEIKMPPEPQPIEIPELSSNVAQVLLKNGFFDEQLNHLQHNRKKYREDVYVGALDQTGERPNGFGKMYKEDQSLYIGYFQNGKAQGPGTFIFPNGSYYSGEFKDNKAESLNGLFKSEQVTYTGGFKNNSFHGRGKEMGPNYEFDGEYNKGNRGKGALRWQAPDGAYEYEGSFNSENKFHATGTLREPHGVYEGQFVNGEKHGRGYFRSVSGFVYKGDYTNDARTGKGQIYDNFNTLIYEGQVKDGFPHGKGRGIREGKIVDSVWEQGIEVQLIY